MWVFNVFLFIVFFFNRPGYEVWKASGMPCYAYVSDHGELPPEGSMPLCWYDPGDQ